MGRISAKVMEARDAINGPKLVDAVAAGSSIVAAGKALGIKEDAAQDLYHRAIRRYYEENAGAREELVARELRTLDLLQRAVMRDAISTTNDVGERVKATDRVLAIMAQRSKMLGLDAAAKVDIEIRRADDVLAEIVQIIDGSVVAADLVRVLPEAG